MFDRSLDVNGFEVRARYTRRTVAEVLEPLCGLMSGLNARAGRPLVVLMAAPPGAGKSTLAQALAMLSRPTRTAAVGMDGFHYPAAYLAAHRDGAGRPLVDIKGAPETYDVAALAALLDRLNLPDQRWPLYDRRIHDPVPEAVEIREQILIVEGNWLLLDEAPWRDLRCDYSIFLRAGDARQLERIVQRKMMGGYGEEAARVFVRENDWPNIQRCMAHSRRGDLNLAPALDGTLEVI